MSLQTIKANPNLSIITTEENPSVPMMDSTSQYEVGKIIFIVEPVYKTQGESVTAILKKLMKGEVEKTA